MLGTEEANWTRTCHAIVSRCHDVQLIMADLTTVDEDAGAALEALSVRVDAFASAYSQFIQSSEQDITQAKELLRDVDGLALEAARIWQKAKAR